MANNGTSRMEKCALLHLAGNNYGIQVTLGQRHSPGTTCTLLSSMCQVPAIVRNEK